MLTNCAFQLLFGKVYTFFGIKYVFLTSILLFEIGSAVCGAAPDSVSFIIGRAIAGLGSAGIMAGTVSGESLVLLLSIQALWQRAGRLLAMLQSEAGINGNSC